MLAKLCLSPLQSRAPLIDQYLTDHVTSVSATDPASSAAVIEIESHNYQPTILALTAPELPALDYENFKSLDETSWVRLVSIYGKFTLTNSSSSASSHALPFEIIERLALDTNASPASRIHAYLFLRSQNYRVISAETFVSFASFVCQNGNPETLAVLLLDSNVPMNGLIFLPESDKSFAEENFSTIIGWIKINTTEVTIIETIMKRFAVLETPSITRQLIELGLNGTCTMQTLHDALSLITISMISMEEPLFSIFQFDHLFFTSKDIFEERNIPGILNIFNTVTELGDASMASEVFNIFIAPGLKAHPEYLLATGKIILNEFPHLLKDFVQIIFNMTLDSEAENNIIQLTNHPNFHIEEYYETASPTFKQLPDVVIAMQLYCFTHNITNTEAHSHTKALHHHLQSLSDTYKNPRFWGSLLAYQVTENELVNKPTTFLDRASRTSKKIFTTAIKQAWVHGKDAKTPFLRYILKHLIQYGEFSSNNTTDPETPFIWSIYKQAYLPVYVEITRRALTKLDEEFSIEKLNSWLSNQILETENAPETQTLLLLPIELRKQLFDFEGSTINFETLKVKTKRASMFSWRSNVDKESDAAANNNQLNIDEESDSLTNNSQLQVLQRNTSGSDYIATDPHGSLVLVEKLVQLLTAPEDRLFFCGDLIDRGPNNIEIIKFLKNQQGMKKIYCIRGNHEDMVLPVLVGIKNFIRSHPSIASSTLEKWSHVSNKYIYPSRSFETLTKFISRHEGSADTRSLTGDERDNLRTFWDAALNLVVNGGAWVFNLSSEDRQLVYDFMEPLPYMIRVEDEFDLIHAAPLSEAELKIANQNGCFTRKQIHYMTWARPVDYDTPIQFKSRTPRSMRAYVGHNSLQAVVNIYQKMNVVNLDAGTYSTHCIFVVNHSQDKVYYIQKDPTINPHLDKDFRPNLRLLRKVMKSSSELTPPALDPASGAASASASASGAADESTPKKQRENEPYDRRHAITMTRNGYSLEVTPRELSQFRIKLKKDSQIARSVAAAAAASAFAPASCLFGALDKTEEKEKTSPNPS